MERTLELGEWTAHITSNGITLSGLGFSPAEADRITGLLGIAGGMANLKAFPPEISDPPFSIKFDETGNHYLAREDTNDFIRFTFEQVDELIRAVNDSTAVSIDIQKLTPSAPPRYEGPKFGDTIDSSR